MKPTGRYAEGAANRQKILDYLHQNPGAVAPVIRAHFNLDKATCAKRLSDMCCAMELTRKPAIYEYTDANGKPSAVATFAYTALVKETQHYIKPTKHEKAPPGVIRSSDLRNPYVDLPIPNQGGQGAARPRCVSSMEYV